MRPRTVILAIAATTLTGCGFLQSDRATQAGTSLQTAGASITAAAPAAGPLSPVVAAVGGLLTLAGTGTIAARKWHTDAQNRKALRAIHNAGGIFRNVELTDTAAIADIEAAAGPNGKAVRKALERLRD
jgi:uncharacterized protein YceK